MNSSEKASHDSIKIECTLAVHWEFYDFDFTVEQAVEDLLSASSYRSSFHIRSSCLVCDAKSIHKYLLYRYLLAKLTSRAIEFSLVQCFPSL